MGKRFKHLDQEWEATGTGIGVGVATGYVPKVSHWGVEFLRVGDPSKEPLRGKIPESDPNQVAQEVLMKELERGLVLRAINESKFLWRTVGGLSTETGIAEESVRMLLEGMPDRVIRSIRPDKDGKTLYTTRDKYKGERSFVKKYLDILGLPSGSTGG